jgi:hypothetical protein
MATIEEIRDFLKDEKNAGAFKELVKGMGFESKEDIEGLKNNNQALIKEKQSLKAKYEDTQKVLDTIDIDEYNELKSKSSKSGKDSDELTKYQRELKKATDALEKSLESRKNIESRFHKSLIEKNLSESLDAAGFDPKHKEILKSAFQGKARIEVDNDIEKVIIDNGDGLGLPALDYFKQYAQSDFGKTYLKQPVNVGAGASGFHGSGGPHDAKGKMLEAENRYKAAQARGDIVEAKAAADESFYWKEQANKPK